MPNFLDDIKFIDSQGDKHVVSEYNNQIRTQGGFYTGDSHFEEFNGKIPELTTPEGEISKQGKYFTGKNADGSGDIQDGIIKQQADTQIQRIIGQGINYTTQGKYYTGKQPDGTGDVDDGEFSKQGKYYTGLNVLGAGNEEDGEIYKQYQARIADMEAEVSDATSEAITRIQQEAEKWAEELDPATIRNDINTLEGNIVDLTSFDNKHNNIENGEGIGSIKSSNLNDDDRAYTEEELPVASGHEAIAFGKKVKATGKRAVAIGNTAISSGNTSLAVGQTVEASNSAATALGNGTKATGMYSMAIGQENEANGSRSFAAGWKTKANSEWTTTFGVRNTADGQATFVTGIDNESTSYAGLTSGTGNHNNAEKSLVIGTDNTNSGGCSITAGKNNTNASTDGLVIGQYNSNNGLRSIITGGSSVASEGNILYGNNSAILGGYNNKIGSVENSGTSYNVIAGGNSNTIYNGTHNFVSGADNRVYGSYKIALGCENITSNDSKTQIILGKHNVVNNDALLIVGGGESNSTRKNLLEIGRDGGIKASRNTSSDDSDLALITKGSATQTSALQVMNAINLIQPDLYADRSFSLSASPSSATLRTENSDIIGSATSSDTDDTYYKFNLDALDAAVLKTAVKGPISHDLDSTTSFFDSMSVSATSANTTVNVDLSALASSWKNAKGKCSTQELLNAASSFAISYPSPVGIEQTNNGIALQLSFFDDKSVNLNIYNRYGTLDGSVTGTLSGQVRMVYYMYDYELQGIQLEENTLNISKIIREKFDINLCSTADIVGQEFIFTCKNGYGDTLKNPVSSIEPPLASDIVIQTTCDNSQKSHDYTFSYKGMPFIEKLPTDQGYTNLI